MAQGDTTIRTDFEVGGVSAAKMSVNDMYKSSTDAMKKASREEITNSQRVASAKKLAAQKSRALTQIMYAEERKAAALKAQQEASAISLQKQRSAALIKIHNDEQAAIRKANALTAREARRLAQQQERDARKLESQKGMMSKLVGRGLWAGALGMAGYAGVAGISGMINGVVGGIQKVIDKRRELEAAIVPIVMLEDNVSKMASIRQEVASTATSLGRSYEEVGRFYSDLVGSTGNLNTAERESLIKETKELSELTGGSLVTAQNLLTKSYQIFGKELVNVNQLQNKLMVTQDQGSIEFEDMALRLPELLQAGKFAQMNIDEVLGSVVGATRKSGSIEKTMTGMRNFFLIMEEAEKKGVTLTGTYTQKLQKLADLFQSNRPKMQELFGKEVVVHASSITDSIDDITYAMGDLAKVTGSADAVFDKLIKRGSDPVFQQIQAMKSYDTVVENAPNIYAGLGMDTGFAEKAKAGKVAASVSSGGWLYDSAAAFAGSILGLDPTYAQYGREIAQSQASPSQFIADKRVDFFRKKQADLEQLKALENSPETRFGQDPEYIKRIQRTNERQLSPHLMTEEERRIYRETGVAPQSAAVSVATSASQERHISALERNTEALLATRQVSANVKPGGAKVNSEETL